jgi:hypothetical protein
MKICSCRLPTHPVFQNDAVWVLYIVIFFPQNAPFANSNLSFFPHPWSLPLTPHNHKTSVDLDLLPFASASLHSTIHMYHEVHVHDATSDLNSLCNKKPRTKKIMIHEQEDCDLRGPRANPVELVPGFIFFLWFIYIVICGPDLLVI